MKQPPRTLIRPTVRRPQEDAGPVGFAKIYVEVDAGAEQHVTFDLKIAVLRRSASTSLLWSGH